MKSFLGYPYRLCFWVFGSWWSDIRSYGVSAVFGFLIGTLTVAWAGGFSKQLQIIPDSDGYAHPMPGLVEHARRSDLEINFHPAELENVWVCEFAHLKGNSGADLFFEYLSKYPECFSLRQTGEAEFVVEPSKRFSALTEGDDGWYCNCPAQ